MGSRFVHFSTVGALQIVHYVLALGLGLFLSPGCVRKLAAAFISGRGACCKRFSWKCYLKALLRRLHPLACQTSGGSPAF